uniref:Envelope glycoprotein gp130 n=1 Tax=Feline foamy virus TaxID=53182 RepID=A0A5J6DHQ8_FFV|nr:envelope protein [Feline foamy virus]
MEQEHVMTLKEWMEWNAHKQLQKLQLTHPELHVDIPEEIHLVPEKVPLKMRMRYRCYTLCATSTRIMFWILFFLLCFSIVTLSTIISILRYQWKEAITHPGPVLSWQVTNSHVTVGGNTSSSFRRRRDIQYHKLPVEVNISGIPQGLFFAPQPKPILHKERTLGLSQVILIDSDTITQGHIKQQKAYLVSTINEEMEQLQKTVLPFDLPTKDPLTQKEYIEKRCFQKYGHCYVIAFNGNKVWPSQDLIQDQCPLPPRFGNNLKYRNHTIWKYYIPLPFKVPSNWTRINSYGNIRIGSFKVPDEFRQNATHGIFCSDALYSDWYPRDLPSSVQQSFAQAYITKVLMKRKKQPTLRNIAFPKELSPVGSGMLFRPFNPYDICNMPRAALLLNKTYYTFSLWEGDCGYYQHNLTLHPACKNFNRTRQDHPYACRFWRNKYDSESVQCYNNDMCYYRPLYDGTENTEDWGWLAYTNSFPSPICIEEKRVWKKNYTLSSVLAECVNQAMEYGIDEVLSKLDVIFGNLTHQSADEAFIPVNNFTWPKYEKQNKHQKTSCEGRKNRRQRRSVSTENLRRMQEAGLGLANAITTVAKISDLNDQKLAKGVHLLRDHVVTLMEANLDDIVSLGEGIQIEHIHNHLTSLKLLTLENRIDWRFINDSWIQEELGVSDNIMKVIRKTARCIPYNVKQTRNLNTSTAWEIYLYYEIIIPTTIYTQNWNIKNLGHLVRNAGYLSKVWIQQPFEVLNQECGTNIYLHMEECVDQDYIICEEVTELPPCGNGTGSDCPVLTKPLTDEYLEIEPLKNGSYLVLSSTTDCGIPAYVPVVITVNDTISCFDKEFKRPLKQELRVTKYAPSVPQLELRVPRLTSLIAKIKGIQIEITSSWETIKEQVARAKAELLRLDLHEGDYPEWLQLLGEATKDVWPTISNFVSGVGNFIKDTAGGIFGTAFSFLGYVKPVLLGFVIIFCIILIIKVIGWLQTTRKKDQ